MINPIQKFYAIKLNADILRVQNISEEFDMEF